MKKQKSLDFNRGFFYYIYFMKKKIAIIFAIVLIAIQFIRPNMENPVFEEEKDYISITQPNEKITSILKTSCYDCHSNETEYPWYMQIAPVSWWTMDHVDEGREEFNFSIWGDYSTKRQKHKLKESVEMIEENEMPLDSYTWMHSEASLSNDQKDLMIEWFKSEMSRM